MEGFLAPTCPRDCGQAPERKKHGLFLQAYVCHGSNTTKAKSTRLITRTKETGVWFLFVNSPFMSPKQSLPFKNRRTSAVFVAAICVWIIGLKLLLFSSGSSKDPLKWTQHILSITDKPTVRGQLSYHILPLAVRGTHHLRPKKVQSQVTCRHKSPVNPPPNLGSIASSRLIGHSKPSAQNTPTFQHASISNVQSPSAITLSNHFTVVHPFSGVSSASPLSGCTCKARRLKANLISSVVASSVTSSTR